jgi:multidrug efflux pump subunit AcrB
LNVNVDRSLAGLVGLSEKDAATAMQTTLAGSSQTSPTYWLNPKTGVSYPVSIQTPPRILGTMSDLKNIPVTTSSGTSTQLLGGLATIERAPSNVIVTSKTKPIGWVQRSSFPMKQRCTFYVRRSALRRHALSMV